MRVLVTTNDAVGHLAPMVATIRALVDAGHDVRVGCPMEFAGTVDQWGLAPLGCATIGGEPVGPSTPPPPPEDRQARLAWAVSQSWPSRARPWVSDLLRQCLDWRPDVVVVEPVEHAGRVVAATLGVPVVEHGWGFGLPAGLSHRGSDSLADLYAAYDARPARPALSVDIGPARIQSADAAPAVRFRYHPWSQPGDLLPERDDRRRALVTLGTFANPEGAARIRLAVEIGLAHGLDVVVAAGHADRRTALVGVGAATLVEWVDLPDAVATCDLVIHHGGAGTSWATMLAGRPAVVLPQMGDQFRNAEILERAGVAVAVPPERADRDALAAAVAHLLDDSSTPASARAVADDNDALPGLDRLVAAIGAVAGGSISR